LSALRPLTRKQQEVLAAIQEHQREQGLSPTLQELGQRLAVNRVTVFGHVQALLQKGFLENLEPGASRGLELTDAGRAVLARRQGEEAENPTPLLPGFRTTGAVPPSWDLPLPLCGRIAAGAAIEAIEQQEEVRMADLLHVREDTYLLEVRGDSMIEEQIRSGDFVVVQRERRPKPGDIVVAILEDETATLKKFHPQPDGSVILQPANRALAPIHVPRLAIRGVVTGVIRRF
jgi:repressor LexA